MSLIYPKSNSGWGDLVAELTALGGVEGRDFFYAHDATHNICAEVTDAMYDAWRTGTPLAGSQDEAAPEPAPIPEPDPAARAADDSGGDVENTAAAKKSAKTGK